MDDFNYQPGLVPLKVNHSDARGYIVNLREGPCAGVAIIESVAGSIRSNHWHREDSHLLYLVSGAMLYFEHPVREDPGTKIPDPCGFGGISYEPQVIRPGEMVFTGPRMEHATVFPIDSTMISISPRPRDHESHEADLVRTELLSEEQAKTWIGWWYRNHGTIASSVQVASVLRRLRHFYNL